MRTHTQENAKDTSSRWRKNVPDGNSNIQEANDGHWKWKIYNKHLKQYDYLKQNI